MITIEQLLESVDLDFEPRFVTKDRNGDVYIFEHIPETYKYSKQWVATVPNSGVAGYECLKLAEFADKDWQKCIYEVPRKVNPYEKEKEWIGKLCRFWDVPGHEKYYSILENLRCDTYPYVAATGGAFQKCEPVRPDDDVIYKAAVNELKGAKNE